MQGLRHTHKSNYKSNIFYQKIKGKICIFGRLIIYYNTIQ